MRGPSWNLCCVLLLTTGLAAGGCGTGLAPNAPLNEAAQTDPLNQVTVGDLVEGFQEFRGELLGAREGHAGRPAPFDLTAEQRNQIEELQGRLDAGEITPDEFLQQVRGLIGDAAPRQAFAGFDFFGEPLDHRQAFRRFAGRLAEYLALTDEQKQQARDIFTRAHEDIRALREQAHADILAVLTDAQRAKLEELKNERFASLRQDRPLPRNGPRAGVRLILERLADALELTREQRDQIKSILRQLRQDVKARHQAARDEFRNLLTDEQRVKLDELENQ